jgi:hypothetical protein
MREILFRAWISRIKMFQYWGIGDLKGDGSYQTGPPAEPKAIHEQYAGIKDKNGTRIFEGDIIKYKRSSRTMQETVCFDNGAFYAGYHEGSSTRKRIKLIQGNRSEVVGNIHEK